MAVGVYVMAVGRQVIHGPTPMSIRDAIFFLRDVATGEAALMDMHCPQAPSRSGENMLGLAAALMETAWEDAVRAGSVTVLPCSPNALRVNPA